VLIGVEQGIVVAVGLAILDRIRLTARPQLHVLGRVPGTTSWTPKMADPDATQVPGVLVVLFATPLWYANAAHFRQEVEGALAQADAPIRVLILDTIGMSDIDFTGSHALARVIERCARDHIVFGVARAGEHAQRSLRRSGLIDRIGEDRVFPSVNEAVTALASGPSPPS
jgi:MFS superfamily sulfate permease-like transporter